MTCVCTISIDINQTYTMVICVPALDNYFEVISDQSSQAGTHVAFHPKGRKNSKFVNISYDCNSPNLITA